MTPPSLPPWPPSDWQPSDPRRVRGGRVALGVVGAIAGHVLTIVLGVAMAAAGSDLFVYALLGSQLVLFVACLAVGIVQIAQGDRGLGIGLLVGWAVGVIVLPVIGFGICVVLLSEQIGAR